MNQQKGFTLIELIVVIVILGILAALALPKFLSMQKEARIAQLHAMEGSLKASSALVYGKALVANPAIDLTQTDQTLNVNADGITTVKVDYGYPQASADGIVATVDVSANDWTITSAGGTTTFQWKNLTNCKVDYQAPTAAGGRPTITVNEAGCAP